MTKSELKKYKAKLAHDIRNIRNDFAGVDTQDIPSDVVAEINEMMTELKAVRELLGNE